MNIGVPKEVKNNESRVALTPAGVTELVRLGHQVYLQNNAGIASGFTDEQYKLEGARITPDVVSTYEIADMIVKVKEPIREEYALIKKNQIVFTYFHFASSYELTLARIERGSVCIAYETVEKADKTLPLLIPMSEVAGRMAIQQGAKYLEKPAKGRGILLGGVPGVPPGRVLVIGAGVVGMHAAKMAAGLGAHVTILDTDMAKLRYVNDIMPHHVITMHSNQYNIRELIKTHDLIVGAVLITGAKAPKLITREMLKEMRPGTVIVDVAVDQGGCIETCRPTTHENPTYMVGDILHYCVANMPGAVPYTSTIALTNATLPYIIQLCEKGWEKACYENQELKKGLNIVNGYVVYKGVADAFDLTYSEVDSVISIPAVKETLTF